MAEHDRGSSGSGRRVRRAPLVAVTALWAVGLALGLGVLWDFQRTAGAAAEARPSWPADSELPRDAAGPTLVQFIHPRCSCSRASLIELRQLLAPLARPPRVVVVFMRPVGLEPGWERSGNWELAHDIPGARVVVDADGVEAARFGAQTSGQTFVYAPDRGLRFSGGITAARGEVGPSVGQRRVVEALRGIEPTRADSTVFGCPLDEPPGERRR